MDTHNTSITTQNFSALYYPETICLDELELKYILLLYDKIFFLPIDVQLNPGHTSLSKRFSLHDATLSGSFKSRKAAHYALMYMAESGIWDDYMNRLMDIYNELEEKNLLVGIKDKDFECATAWHPLRAAIDTDMKDRDFISLCNQYKNPKNFVPLTEGAVIKGGGFLTRPSNYKKEYAIPSICSERLNSTLFFAEREGLFPVSPYRMYVDLLNIKLKRIATMNNGKFQSTQPNAQSRSHKVSIMSWEITTEVVPRHVISRKSANDILRYKLACAELKDRFHSYLFSLEASINSEPWDKSFAKELNKEVKKGLLPEIQNIRDQKSIIWEKLFGEAIKSLTSIKVLPPLIGLHLIPGLSFWDILSMSTVLVGTATLPSIIDAWREERQIRRNSLFFLVNFTKQ